MIEFAECRGCRKKLDGKPYYMGGRVHDPVTRKEAPANFYGGFVCSRSCDYRASLDHEQTMPGHGSEQSRPGSFAMERIKQNWGE